MIMSGISDASEGMLHARTAAMRRVQYVVVFAPEGQALLPLAVLNFNYFFLKFPAEISATRHAFSERAEVFRSELD